MQNRPSRSRHELALAAIAKGKDELALSHFEAAVAATPNDTAVHLDFARFLTCLYRYSSARNHLQQACDLLPDQPAVVLAAAKVASDGRAPELALTLLRRVQKHPDAHLQAAIIHERMGDLEAAANQLELAEQLEAPTVDSHLLSARLAARVGDHSRTLTILDILMEKAPDDPWTQARIQYARGYAYDALGDYENAFASWSTAKESLRPLAGNLLTQSEAELTAQGACAAKLTPDVLTAWRDQLPSLQGPLPVEITGYPRSGTTILERSLVRSTGIPSADENDSFRDLVWRRLNLGGKNGKQLWKGLRDLHPPKAERLRSEFQEALKELSGAQEPPLIFEKNPHLLSALPILLRVIPRLPIIVIHRDPRDVILSCFAQAFGLNPYSVNYLSVKQAAIHYRNVRQIADRLKTVLGDQMLVTQYESLVSAPETELDRLRSHLQEYGNLPPPAEKSTSLSRTSYSPSYAEADRPVTTTAVGRWKNYAKFLEPHLEPILPFLGPSSN